MAAIQNEGRNSGVTSHHSTSAQQEVQKCLEEIYQTLISANDVKLSEIRSPLNKLLIYRFRYNSQKKIRDQLEERSEFKLDGLEELIKSRKPNYEDLDDEILLDSAKLRKYEEEKRDREFREEVPFLEMLSEFYKQKYEITNQKWDSGWQDWLRELREKIKTILVIRDFTVDTVLPQLEEQLSSYNSYYSNWCSSLRAFELLISCQFREPEKTDDHLLKAVSLMNVTTKSAEEILKTIKHNKHNLKTLRESHGLKKKILTSEIELINKNEPDCVENSSLMRVFSNLVQAAMNQIASDVRHFTAIIVDQCIELLGEGCPCGVSVIGIGSLARSETTSFSDVEFLFIIQDDTYREYFYRLSTLMYFLIGSLGESNLKTLAIQELKSVGFADEAPKGFRIDGLGRKAGNMPTGNGVCPDTELIFTPDQFLHEYKSALYKPNLENSRDVDSTIIDMTSHMTEIWTNSDETNLLKELKIRLDCVPRTEQSQATINRLLITDIDKYNFLPSTCFHSGRRDVKVDFYRFISLLLSGLNNLLQLQTTSNWACIDKLKSLNKTNEPTAQILRFLLASSLYIRLAAYHHYNCQRDSITVFPLNQTNNLPIPHSQYSVCRKLFTFIMSYLIPFKLTLNRVNEHSNSISQIFTQSDSILNIRQETCLSALICAVFYGDSESEIIKMITSQPVNLMGAIGVVKQMCDITQLFSLAKLRYFEMLFGDRKLSTEQIKPLFDLFASPNTYTGAYCQGLVLMKNKPSEAVEYFKQALLCLDDDDQAERVNVYHLLALSYLSIGDLRGCEKYSDLMKADIDNMFDSVKYDNDTCMFFRGTWLNVFGCLRHNQGKHQDALRLHQQALIMCHRQFGSDTNNPMIGDIINRIALCHGSLNKYGLALKYYNKSLSLRYALNGTNSSDVGIAGILGNIGQVYLRMNEFDKAEEYLFKAYDMYCKIFNCTNHPVMACCIGSIAASYHKQSRYQESLEWFKKEYDIYSSMSPGDINNKYYAECCEAISVCYFNTNQYDKSVEFGIKAYDMFCKIYNCTNHPVMARCIHFIAASYLKQSRYQESLEWLEKQYDIYSSMSPGDIDNKYYAACCGAISVCYFNTNQYDKSVEFGIKAYEMLCQIDNCTNHLDMACCIGFIASSYGKQSRYQESLEWYEKQYDIFSSMSPGDIDNKQYALCCRVISVCCFDTNQYDKSVEFGIKAYEMFCKIYNCTNHPDMVNCISIIAASYGKQCRYQESLEWYEKQYDIYSSMSPGDINNKYYAECCEAISMRYFDMNQYDKSAEFGIEAYELYTNLNDVSVTESMIKLCYKISISYTQLGNFTQSIAWRMKAVRLILVRHLPYIYNIISDCR